MKDEWCSVSARSSSPDVNWVQFFRYPFPILRVHYFTHKYATLNGDTLSGTVRKRARKWRPSTRATAVHSSRALVHALLHVANTMTQRIGAVLCARISCPILISSRIGGHSVEMETGTMFRLPLMIILSFTIPACMVGCFCLLWTMFSLFRRWICDFWHKVRLEGPIVIRIECFSR